MSIRKKNSITKFLVLLAFTVSAVVLSAQTDTKSSELNWQNNARCFSRGLERKMASDVDGAVKSFREALTYNPEDAASMYELSELLTRTNPPAISEAFEMIEQAVKIDSTNKWYWLRLSRFHELNSDYESLVNVYKRILTLDPSSLEVMSNLIGTYMHLERYQEAIEVLDNMEKLQGISEPVTLQKVEIYVQDKNFDKAIAEMERLSAKFPSETRYMSMLANLYLKANRDEDAIRTYNRIKETNPQDPYVDVAMLEFYDKKGEVDLAFDKLIDAIGNPNLDYNTKIEVYDYWFKKDLPKAKIDNMARRAAEAFIAAYPDKAIGYSVMGTCNFTEKKYDMAKDMYAKALSIDSTSFYVWQQLLVLNDVMGTPADEILKISLSAMRFFPTQPLLYWYAGQSYTQMNNRDRAIELFEKGKKFVADREMLSTFNSVIGDLYHQKGDKDKAYDYYEHALAANPDNILVLNNYAYYLALDSLRLEKAVTMSKRAVELNPGTPTYLDTYAWACYMSGDYERAAKVMRKALSLSDKKTAIYYEHYGDILYKSGKQSKAVKNWKKAIQFGGNTPELESKIKNGKL